MKKAERGAIDFDEVALDDDEVHVEGDEHEGKHHETNIIVSASSSVVFDIRSAFETILGRFDSLNTRLDFMEHKQDELIV